MPSYFVKTFVMQTNLKVTNFFYLLNKTLNMGVKMLLEVNKSVPQLIQEIVGTNGIFHIQWRKKDRRQFIDNEYGHPVTNPDYDRYSILRTGNFRLGVVKNLKGGKRNTDPNDFLIAFDMSKKGYRNIYYNTIEKITANKQTFYVKVLDTKHYRLGLVESTKND